MDDIIFYEDDFKNVLNNNSMIFIIRKFYWYKIVFGLI